MAATFRASDLVIERSEQLREIPAPETLGFGRHFTDHMLVGAAALPAWIGGRKGRSCLLFV